MKYKVSLTIISLLTVISISSFVSVNSLIKAVENGYANHSQLTVIEKLGLNTLLYKHLNTYVDNDPRWQNIAKSLAKSDGEVAFKLAQYYKNKQGDNNQNIELWLAQAIRLGHQQARIDLAKIYFSHNKLLAAKKLLLPISSNGSALTLLLEVLISIGEKPEIDRYIKQLETINADKPSEELESFSKKLLRYNVLNTPHIPSQANCLASIAPYATNLRDLAYFEELISSSTLATLQPYLCFSPVQYISKITLACHQSTNEAIRCDESIWPNNKRVSVDRFIAVLVEKGGANVNAGILYIDRHDNAEVFYHELAHLLGFIDEYALPKNHSRCLAVQNAMFSHNVAILPRFYQGSREKVRAIILSELPWAKYISRKTSLVTHTAQGWKLGTVSKEGDSVGAFIAESCNEKDFVAIKPLKQRTRMRYYQTGFPALYLQLLADNPEKFLMPHYLHNVSLAIEAKK